MGRLTATGSELLVTLTASTSVASEEACIWQHHEGRHLLAAFKAKVNAIFLNNVQKAGFQSVSVHFLFLQLNKPK